MVQIKKSCALSLLVLCLVFNNFSQIDLARLKFSLKLCFESLIWHNYIEFHMCELNLAHFDELRVSLGYIVEIVLYSDY